MSARIPPDNPHGPVTGGYALPRRFTIAKATITRWHPGYVGKAVRVGLRLAEVRLKTRLRGDRAGSADVRGRSVSVVRFCEGVRSGGCSFGGGDVSVHRC
jgi:hypothetical protein